MRLTAILVWMALLFIMVTQVNISGRSLQLKVRWPPLHKIVPALTLTKQVVPEVLQHLWGMTTSVILEVNVQLLITCFTVMILCGMELVVGL